MLQSKALAAEDMRWRWGLQAERAGGYISPELRVAMTITVV